MSSFLFYVYIDDIEDTLSNKGFKGVDLGMLKLYLLLYADDIVLFSESEGDLQNGLDILKDYCNRWKLIVNVEKTKVMIFKKGGRLRRGINFRYDGKELEIVNKFCYLGILFSPGLSYTDAHNTLAGQALKALFKLNGYLYKFVDISVSHSLSLFDKLITPILSYGQEVWGFQSAIQIERIQLHFCKQLLGVKRQTQNAFIYGELGRLPLQQRRYLSIIKYWLKITRCHETKYIKIVYNIMLTDLLRYPNRTSWVSNVKKLIDSLGFGYVWTNQGVENIDLFLVVLKQRTKYCYSQLWNGQLEESSRASCFRMFATFGFKQYPDYVKI